VSFGGNCIERNSTGKSKHGKNGIFQEELSRESPFSLKKVSRIIIIFNRKNSPMLALGFPHFLFAVRNSGGTECQKISVIPRSLLRG
jgi:hypothetical protein